MNVLLTPYAREEKKPDPLLVGLLSYSCNDGFGRSDQLNFATPSDDETEYPGGAYLKKGKVPRQDPLSHRIIEKRRRDRMNNCLADLSRLIPPEYLKKGRGRVEKTEIIEMAIRHLKYLQERANAAERQAGEEHFRAGYSEAVGEAVRFLVEVRGYSPADGLCMQMTGHMQRHVEAITKGDVLPREKFRPHPNCSSGNTSSSSSSNGFASKGVITQALPPAPPPFQELYEEPYPMECDRVSASQIQLADSEAQDLELPIDGRRNPEPKLRAVRKPEHNDDYLQSYKFKNCIERRFSRSQDSEITEATDMVRPTYPPNKVYTHKRRRVTKPASSLSTSNSGSNEETRDTSPQDTSSESLNHNRYEKPPTHYVPIFALNATGKYYVPLNIDYASLARNVGPFAAGMLDARPAHLTTPLHPFSINVDFQSCMDYHVKRERTEEWRNE